MRHALSVLSAALLLLALAPPRPVAADDDPVVAPAPEPVTADLPAAIVTGDRVNLRVGPRMDNRPVAQLAEGTVVLVVERVPGWAGVLVPEGFPAVVSASYVEEVGPDEVEVVARNLNLRVEPPQEGRPAPGIFRDHPDLGARLTLISNEGDWVWVVAPEGTRAYLNERFLTELGPASQHGDRLDAARRVRAEKATRLSAARRAASSQTSGMRLREVMSVVQAALLEARREAGYDKTPIVQLADRLDAALQREAHAPERVLTMALALREDLEREIVLRVARYDAALARERGLSPSPVPPLEEPAASLVAEGIVKYEPTPGWREEGIYLLWVGERPAYVLRLTTGGQLPHPDFGAHVERPVRVSGARPGERLFGLPVLEVKTLEPAAPQGT
jgi:hypothetical protein